MVAGLLYSFLFISIVNVYAFKISVQGCVSRLARKLRAKVQKVTGFAKENCIFFSQPFVKLSYLNEIDA